MSESLFLKVARNTWDVKKNKMERTEQKIYPEKSFDLQPEHQGHKMRYNLTGGIIHRGGANSGHYLNILCISGKWYEIDDEKARTVPEKEAIQQVGSHGVLIMYQRERGTSKDWTRPGRTASKLTAQNKKGTKQKHTGTGTQARQPTGGSRRHRYFRPYKTGKPNRARREQWGEKYAKEHKGYYDPDKKCFYIPKL
jgi:hypothetical protein